MEGIQIGIGQDNQGDRGTSTLSKLTHKENMKYTLRLRFSDDCQSDVKVESDNLPRIGEIVKFGSNDFTVIEVMHSVEPDDGFNRGVLFVETFVLCD